METLIRSRSFLWLLVRRELRVRYAGSVLGSLWNVIHPLFLIGIYVLVFSSVMRKVGGGMSRGAYVTHLCAGLLPWLVFSETLARCTGILAENANFIRKLPFPLEVLHFSVLVNSLIVQSISAVALIVLLMAFGYPLGPSVLNIFPLMVGAGLAAMGLGMFFSVLNLFLRDVGQLISLALQVLFWLLPIVYVPAALPGFVSALEPGWVWQILAHNPILGFVTAAQTSFGSPQALFSVEMIYLMVFFPAVSLWAGHAFLYSRRAELLDLI